MRPGPLFLGWPWRLRLALIRGQDLEGGEGAALWRAAVRSEPGIKRPVPWPGRPRSGWWTRAHSDPDDSDLGPGVPRIPNSWARPGFMVAGPRHWLGVLGLASE